MRKRRSRRGALEQQLKGYRLATAEITYRMPDHPTLLQTFVWQHYDIAPHFPRLRRFLDYWRDNLDGELHSVKVGRAQLVRPAEITAASALFIH